MPGDLRKILDFKGKLATDHLTRVLYSTDASAYCEMPRAVAFPEDEQDVARLVRSAFVNRIPLIPRAAGTSIAGQVVGDGVVMDIGKHLNKIIEINAEERWVRVQPGVVRDELNIALKPYGLFFSPETSTSNRCMIGGMVGNNSCGSHSLRYGSVRDHLLEAKVVLADGTQTVFRRYSAEEIEKVCDNPLECSIYSFISKLLSSPENLKTIADVFPSPELKRRNNGYAIDLVKDDYGGINLCKLLCGSEGTLAVATELKLNLDIMPPKHNALVCVHCSTLEAVFRANLIAISKKATAIELIDNNIIKLSQKSPAQRVNSFFVEGDPAAIMAAEFACDSEDELHSTIEDLIVQIKKEVKECYAFPIVQGKDIQKVWNLRKAGLGLLSNMEGDAKPVSVIEDTAVVPSELGKYVIDIKKMLRQLDLECVFYAHIGSGELHLRPIINLKTEEGRKKFREVATNTAILVRKYHGSLSGEHGDGRLRGEFIPLMYGYEVYQWFKEIKRTFDANNILNPGKIVDTKPMDEYLRYMRSESIEDIITIFAYNGKHGGLHYIRDIEKCNGAADCRKSILFGGTMCPQYRTSGEEKETTRARANILRYAMLNMGSQGFGNKDVLELLDECLSCKGCKHDCPSTVDMTKLKAEYLQQTYDRNGIPFRTWLVGVMPEIEKIAGFWPKAYNLLINSGVVHSIMGFDHRRVLPEISNTSFYQWYKKHIPSTQTDKQVLLFVDEFTAHEDVRTGIAFVELAEKMGYSVEIAPINNSGRTLLSEGLLRYAKVLVERNMRKLRNIVGSAKQMVVLEPAVWSAFRDEYHSLTDHDTDVLDNVLLYDEWFINEIKVGRICFDTKPVDKKIFLHGHCHQKALGGVIKTKQMLESIKGVKCDVIETSCCGMAGAYGYQHYERSKEIASPLIEFVKSCPADDIITAPGISCRRQIEELTGRSVVHPIVVMNELLRDCESEIPFSDYKKSDNPYCEKSV